MAKQKTRKTPAIETMNIGAAAVDIGSREHMAAVNPDVTDAPVRAFGTFTHGLHDLADWFKMHGVTSVAMESTGAYWIPAYEILRRYRPARFSLCQPRQRHTARFPGSEVRIWYRFHPRSGEIVQVVAQSRHGGTGHLTIVQCDGTLAKIPIWMTAE